MIRTDFLFLSSLEPFEMIQLLSTNPCHGYQDGPLSIKDTETKLYPLSWPKLQLHQHHTFIDPHHEYLKRIDSVPLQEDGTCEVIKMRMGLEIQEFSSSPVSIRSHARLIIF
jgi:hypothetical protein